MRQNIKTALKNNNRNKTFFKIQEEKKTKPKCIKESRKGKTYISNERHVYKLIRVRFFSLSLFPFIFPLWSVFFIYISLIFCWYPECLNQILYNLTQSENNKLIQNIYIYNTRRSLLLLLLLLLKTHWNWLQANELLCINL